MACLSDSDLMALLQGPLSEEQRSRLLIHVAGCDACRQLLAELVDGQHDAGDAEIPFERSVGRYQLRHLVGMGGMGAVYRAFDPGLGREIAIKLVRQDRLSGSATRRLLHEARVLARLSSPYVIQIHDVGVVDDELFIAMEMIQGANLQVWLERPAERPSVAQRLALLREAARGLQAAHQAGIVHRDFKPANVLVRADGHAVVSDFGLARQAAVPESGSAGTWQFMAPEQRSGQPATKKSDQYGFCKTMELCLGSDMPGWCKPVVARGLAEDPDHRFDEMADLLAAMDRGQRRRYRMWLAVSTGLGLLGLALALFFWWQHQVTRCGGGTQALDPAWNESRHQVLQEHWRNLRGQVDPANAAAVLSGLDAYARIWVTQHQAACEAARQHETLPPKLYERSLACLDHARLRLASLVNQLSSGRAAVWHAAPRALNRLPDPVDCLDRQRLQQQGSSRAVDPVRRKEQQDLQQEVSELHALCDTGQLQPCHDTAISLVDRLEDWPVLKAQVALRLGEVQGRTGQQEARKWLTEAERLFEANRSDRDRFEVLLLRGDLAHKGRKPQPGQELLERARAVMLRLGRKPRDQARLLAREALAAILQGRPDQGLDLAEQGLTLKPQTAHAGSARLLRLSLLDKKALALGRLGRVVAKFQANQETLALAEQLYGNMHPKTAAALRNLGAVCNALGRYQQAREYLLRARHIAHRLGASLQLTSIQRQLALCTLGQGKPEEALRMIQQAMQLQKTLDRDNAVRLAGLRCTLGQIQLARRDLDGARHSFEKALEIRKPSLGAGHPDLACELNGLGHVALARQQPRQAVEWFRQSIANLEAAHMHTRDLADALAGWVAARRASGQSDFIQDHEYIARAAAIYRNYESPGQERIERMQREGMLP